MAVLTKDDFITIITIPALDSLTGSNDAIIDTMIVEAMLEMFSYLSARYELDEILGGDWILHPTLQMYCKDIVLYHLHSRHHARLMPAIRAQRYEKALQWLKEVQEQKCNPFAYIAGSETTKILVKGGGNEKRSNHQL